MTELSINREAAALFSQIILKKQTIGTALALVLCVFAGKASDNPATPINVLTANYDNARTNANLHETILNTSNVNKNTFGKLASFPVDGQIYAQPLYVSGVQIPGRGIHNIVYTVTMHNSVYAMDADALGSTTPLWQVNLGPSVPSSVLNFTDILPEVGILSTPVIDLVRHAIYVVSETLENDAPVFHVHALSLSDGHEMLHGPVVVRASVKGTGSGTNDAGTMEFDASVQLQRPGLILLDGVVFVAFGSHGDDGNFHGWMIGYNASDLRKQVAVLNTTPNTIGGSIWQAGRAPAVDSSGNIYVSTGNGEFDGKSEFSDSVLKLSGRHLSILDWYTPDNWAVLRDKDQDLGSAGVILVPNTDKVLAIGKAGNLLMVGSGNMGHLGPMNSVTAHSIVASPRAVFDFALWNRSDSPIVYVHQMFGPLVAYQLGGTQIDSGVLSQTHPTVDSMFAGIAISAESENATTAIVWQTTADFNTRQLPGTLHAFDANDLSHELWNSDQVPDRDTLGRFAKFVAPTVVNGRVYVPTFSNQLVIYGLLSTAAAVPPEVKVTVVANAASLLTGPVSPGEAVTIFGANLGPATMSTLQLDGTNHAADILNATQVFFDDIPAPLLYVSKGEIGAITPFEISGPETVLRVVSNGQSSVPVTIPVVAASPALYSLDGTGGGQASAVNPDGSLNSRRSPVDRGAVIVLSATGIGAIDPQGQDGMFVVANGTMPSAVLPVTVLIDGQPAEVLSAGVAPGQVQGLAQINARIPASVSPWYMVPVIVKVGDYMSPSIITLNIR